MTTQTDLRALVDDMTDAAAALTGTEPALAELILADAAVVNQTADQLDLQAEWLRRLVREAGVGGLEVDTPEPTINFGATASLTIGAGSTTPPPYTYHHH